MRALCLAATLVALAGCKHTVKIETCSDRVQNLDESDVDCGGATCPACGTDRRCHNSTDCQSHLCQGDGHCGAASCSDKLRNGSESDVDCGGPDCADCPDGKICYGNNDCHSRVCAETCVAPSCSDGFENGDETGVDCGGACPPCD
jgi:hypothetical protein